MIPKLNEYKERWEISSESAIKPGLTVGQVDLLKIGKTEMK